VPQVPAACHTVVNPVNEVNPHNEGEMELADEPRRHRQADGYGHDGRHDKGRRDCHVLSRSGAERKTLSVPSLLHPPDQRTIIVRQLRAK